jgi:hypothetical protein
MDKPTKQKKPMTPMQMINSAGIIALVFGLVCGFDAEAMSTLFIMLVVNLTMAAVLFGGKDSGGQ